MEIPLRKLWTKQLVASRIGELLPAAILILGLAAMTEASFAQASAEDPASPPASHELSLGQAAVGEAPLTITLSDALQRARLNDPQ